MNRHEANEVATLTRYQRAGVQPGMIARSMSALIRATRTKKARAELLRHAAEFGVIGHPEFII